MAVVKTTQPGKLVVKVQSGVNSAGTAVYRQRTFANLKPAATDADVYAIGHGLGSLQTYPVSEISRQDNGNLVDQ